MAIIKKLKGKTPEFGDSCYLADNAVIIGDVITGDHCSFWFNTVVRGDVNSIRIGNKVNVQDGTIIHCSYKKASTSIGDNVSIGHNAIVHGCTIENDVLIGMGAIVMDHAVVKSNSIIAAGAIVLEETIVETGWVYGGTPAKKIKEMDSKLSEGEIKRIADNYVMYSSWYME